MEKIFKKYSLLNSLNVPREKTAKNEDIRERHIIDSAQIIDFIDLNGNTTCDLGSGGGLPGIVVAIIAKKMKKKTKFKLYEKSYHKSSFLRDVSKKLNLDIKVVHQDIFKTTNIESGTIMSRAFKPLPVVLDLVHNNFNSYNNLIMFMGKNGKQVLKEVSKKWDFEYKEKRSLTSEDSFLLNIKNIKKKN